MSETATKKKEPGMATLVIVLFAICAATALLLGLTNYVTAPFIAANNEKTTQEAMAAVLPADSYDEVEYTGGDAMVQAVYKAGDAGYVVEVKPATSFSGNLTIMVGVDNTGACSGISITSTGETSGRLQRQQAGLPGPVRGQDRRGQGHQGRRRHRRPDRRYHHLPRRLRGRHQRHRRRREHGLRRVIEYERDETI